MKRTLCISDIHGCHKEFNELLRIVNFNPKEDKLILLGDYCDRGPKSKEVIEQVKSLVEEFNVVALRGNHDQMLIDALNGNDDYIFLRNGGISTIESYCGLNWFEGYQEFDYDRYVEAKNYIKQHYQHHFDFLKSLPFYHEDENYIYVHAGLHPMYENWREQPVDNFLWIRDLFLNNQTQVDKTVVFGHTPTINIQKTADVYFGGGKIGIDGGCVFGLRLNALEISDEGYKTYSVTKGNRAGLIQ